MKFALGSSMSLTKIRLSSSSRRGSSGASIFTMRAARSSMRTHVRVVELLGVVGEHVDVVAPASASYVTAASASFTRIELGSAPSARCRIGSALSFCPLSSIASPTICARFCAASGRTQLHLAELGDHLEATDLAVHFARARQCLEIVGMQLPRTLIQRRALCRARGSDPRREMRARTVVPTARACCPKLRAPSRARRSFASNPATDAGVPVAACAYPSAVYPPAISKETTPLILTAFLSRRANALWHPTRRKALRNSMAPPPTKSTEAPELASANGAANMGSVDDKERPYSRQSGS